VDVSLFYRCVPLFIATMGLCENICFLLGRDSLPPIPIEKVRQFSETVIFRDMKLLGRVESWSVQSMSQQVNFIILIQPLRQYFKPNEHDIYQTKGNTNDINDEKHSNRRRLDYYAGITCVIFFIAFGPIYIYHALRCFDIDIPMNQCYLVDQWLKMLPWLRKGFKIVLINNSSLLC